MDDRSEIQAAPPDDGGHRGTQTRGDETLSRSTAEEHASPPLASDANRPSPRRTGLGGGVILVLLVVSSVLWVMFRWALVE